MTKTPVSRILVVDDNEDAANSLSMILKLEGHDVQSAYGGAQALDAIERFTPHIVLLDIGLPEMDGYEVARRVRAQPGGQAVQLFALTGYGQDSDREQTRAAGFDDHFVKPVDMNKLRQALRSSAMAREERQAEMDESPPPPVRMGAAK